MNVPLGQEDKVRRFFSDISMDWDSVYGGKRNPFLRFLDHAFRRDIYERYQLTFERLGTDLSGRTILDIGCGSGVYCIEAARRGAAEVLGIDISSKMVELARTHSRELGYEHVCKFVCMGFPLQHPIHALKQTFDYGIVMGVMDYVADADLFMKHLRPLIKGFVILSFPGKHWFREPVRKYRYKLLGRCTLYSYEEEDLRKASLQAGFSRVDIQKLDHSGICYIVTAYA